MSDRKRGLYFVGGRITGALAEYFFTHMQVIRPNTDPALVQFQFSWPQYVLEHERRRRADHLRYPPLRAGDGEPCRRPPAQRGAEIIVFTDQWGSPAAKLARHTFRVQIEAPSAWDSSVVTLFLVEALIEAVQSSTWDETNERMKTLEGLFEQTRLFRKPELGGEGQEYNKNNDGPA